MQIVMEMIVHEAEPPSARAKELRFEGALPPGFDGWFLRCVRLNDKERYVDADEALAELERALDIGSLRAPVVEESQELVASRGTETRRGRWHGRRWRYVAALVAVVLACLGFTIARRQRCEGEAVLVTGGRATEGGAPRVIGAFCMDRDEVTVESFERCTQEGRCARSEATALIPGQSIEVAHEFDAFCNAGKRERKRHPMNCVDASAARAFCAAQRGDLPTEDQWERAALGGRPTGLYPWGDDAHMVDRMNGCGRECGAVLRMGRVLYEAEDGYATTAPVGSFRRGDTPTGLRDMAGNVSEWTLGRGGAASVLRGSGWIANDPVQVRVGARMETERHARLPFVGFRCVTRPR